MKNAALAAILALAFCVPPAQAQSDALIEFDTGRTDGTPAKQPVLMRAILVRPATPTRTVVLFYRGIPGYAKIQSLQDKQRNLLPFMREAERQFMQAGIALAIMDCPTDQWGEYGGSGPTSCLDDYRSSKQHADDVRGIMAKLTADYDLSRFYLLGHSQGTISSRWLARHLGNEIAGSIHSASINVASPRGWGQSMRGFAYDSIAAPMLHVHNEKDACRGTPYGMVRAYAKDRLMTVRGGTPEGDPCGTGHLHSHQGREEVVAKAIITWIKTGTVTPLVGD